MKHQMSKSRFLLCFYSPKLLVMSHVFHNFLSLNMNSGSIHLIELTSCEQSYLHASFSPHMSHKSLFGPLFIYCIIV